VNGLKWWIRIIGGLSRYPARARALVWTVIAGEATWGIVIDIYKLARGYPLAPPVPWMIIHSVIIATGILALRQSPALKGGLGQERRP
jgi:hypothetical protein